MSKLLLENSKALYQITNKSIQQHLLNLDPVPGVAIQNENKYSIVLRHYPVRSQL